MIKIAIVEDDQENSERIQSYINKYSEDKNVNFHTDIYYDGNEIVNEEKLNYDIILLDIEMPIMNGMDAAKIIRERNKDVVLVFITNMAQYAIEGYSVGALDFILKPLEYYPFSLKLTRAIERAAKRENVMITLKMDDNITNINIQDILYVEIQNRMLHYHTKNGKFVVRGTMKSVEEQLENYYFEKCNHWFLVNLRYVSGIRGNIVIVNGNELEISRRNKTKFLTAVTNYIGGNS